MAQSQNFLHIQVQFISHVKQFQGNLSTVVICTGETEQQRKRRKRRYEKEAQEAQQAANEQGVNVGGESGFFSHFLSAI